MNRFFLLSFVAFTFGLSSAQPTWAQLFGERNLGATINPRSTQSARQMPGLNVRGRRFSRGARRGSSFVGTDRGDARQFVGRDSDAATPLIRSAVSALTTNQSTGVNQPLQQTAAGTMYLPRLVLANELRTSAESEAVAEKTLSTELANRLTSLIGSPIGASVVNRTATIHGVVVSATDRRRAEILASFEPGVSAVQNDLQVAADSEAPVSPVPPEPSPSFR
jgi:hypothetical protein